LDFDEGYFLKRIEYISELAVKREAAEYNCGKCILRGNCRKGCMATAYIHSGNLFADDGECDLRKMQLVGLSLKDQLRR
jgi:radical SAM protein with 4Fe4S-binding SPASM domain